MELSNIRKDANKSELLEKLNIFAELNASKVALWQKKETDKLLNDDKTVYIIPVTNGFKVGRSAVYEKPHSWVVTCKSQKLQPTDFNTKKQALLYALLMENGYMQEAQEFKDAFNVVQKYLSDIVHYKHSIRAARKSNDLFKEQAIENRLDDAMIKLDGAQKNFEKTIKSAKYIKLRDSEK